MENILVYVGMAGFAQALTWAKPFRTFLNIFNLDDNEPVCHVNVKETSYSYYVNPDSVWTWIDGHLHMILRELFSCSLCMSFWIGFGYTGNIWSGGVAMVFTKAVEWLHSVVPMKLN